MNASGALLFNAVLHEKFAQEVTENGYLKDLLSDVQSSALKHACVCVKNL